MTKKSGDIGSYILALDAFFVSYSPFFIKELILRIFHILKIAPINITNYKDVNN